MNLTEFLVYYLTASVSIALAFSLVSHARVRFKLWRNRVINNEAIHMRTVSHKWYIAIKRDLRCSDQVRDSVIRNTSHAM